MFRVAVEFGVRDVLQDRGFKAVAKYAYVFHRRDVFYKLRRSSEADDLVYSFRSGSSAVFLAATDGE